MDDNIVICDEEPVDDSGEQYKFYADEIAASEEMLHKWQKRATKIVDIYLGSAGSVTTANELTTGSDSGSLNLFHTNIQTLSSMLYGNLPKVDVSRRYADSSDDVGRVAAETMERMLNLDIQENGSEYDSVLRSTLFDRLVSGLGCAKVRYEVETESVEVEGIFDEEGGVLLEERMVSETAPVEYYFWGDVLWSWARNFSEVRWIAYRNYLTNEEVTARFGEEVANGLTFTQQKKAVDDDVLDEADTSDNTDKAEVWEIWDKTQLKVCWVSIGYPKVLEVQDDPYQLTGFFPSPPFLMANATTSLYIPTPDYILAQDLYTQINVLQERINIITEAVRVVGVYDAAADGVQRMLKEGTENSLIPVDNWAMFAEKGGIKGQVDWLPIQDIVVALDKLREMRTETIGLLQQVTGMSDIMRGELKNQYEALGQSTIKAKFGSVRVQALQDQFATFASNLMQLKAEIIAKHFSPETIATASNMQQTVDAELLPQAIELIKNPTQAKLQIVIRSESIAMMDYAQMQGERTQYLTAMSTFLTAAAPMISEDPATKPFLMQVLKWTLAGFKGSNEIEGVLDKAIEASMQAEEGKEGEPEKPDPAIQLAQMQMQLEQLQQQGALAAIQAKTQADQTLRAQDEQADIQTAAAAHQFKMEEIQASTQSKLVEIEAKLLADSEMEQVQTQANILQNMEATKTEIEKERVSAELEIQTDVAKTATEIRKLAATKMITPSAPSD